VDRDLCRARIEVRLHTCADRALVARRDEGVDQLVGAAVLEVAVGEAEPPEVVEVVRGVEVPGESRTGPRAAL
jgi:hypothetical protein